MVSDVENPSAIVIIFPGTNCHVETARALSMAKFEVREIHVNELLQDKSILEQFQLLALPGGFSYGDDIASGKVAANKLLFKLEDQIKSFANDKLIIGICNGFQILVKAGLLPAVGGDFKIQATLTYNDLGHFYCDWVKLKNVNSGKCVYTRGIDFIELPVAHGEGKFVVKEDHVFDQMEKNDQIVFKYMKHDKSPANGAFPHNPGNSLKDIAGICDPTGRILGLMPHPERYLLRYNHPRWTAGFGDDEENGIRIFQNARDYVIEHLI
ncbi:phosphoribosylformylglycinamidine synthase I [Candidatus Bathyarchaeota archaeon]|nr:phosphoribosylformylglycinamidine synthase I [Candidatus Bathyarchaeota archaeon]